MLLLPLPFGPTTAVIPRTNSISVLSANDLKPANSIRFRNITRHSPLTHYTIVFPCQNNPIKWCTCFEVYPKTYIFRPFEKEQQKSDFRRTAGIQTIAALLRISDVQICLQAPSSFRSNNAAAAACCSASFLERPLPLPSERLAIYTSETNSRSCAGPRSSIIRYSSVPNP